MSDRTGYIVIFDEEQRADLLHDRGDYDGRFADALSAPDWGLKEWEVCFISFGAGSIDYACLAQRGKRVATAKYRVDFSNLVDLSEIPLGQLAGMIPNKLQGHFTRSSTGRGRKVPKETWKSLVNSVKELRPQKSEDIDRLLRLRDASLEKFTGNAADNIALEKDAVGVALDIFAPAGDLRKRTLQSWAPTDEENLAPFLLGVDAVTLTEEQMLAHDSVTFPDARVRPTMIGSRFQIGSRLLDVIYLNRTKVENTIGVDLIYYNHFYDSYTLVQYKRMTKEKSGRFNQNAHVYRPSADKNFAIELDRMNQFKIDRVGTRDSELKWKDYRLNPDAFYFKFCQSTALEVLSSDLIKGMYLPKEYLENLLESRHTSGPREGKIIMHENMPRYINNTDFTRLVHEGWVGTKSTNSKQITEIIREALSADRAVVYARSSDERDQ